MAEVAVMIAGSPSAISTLPCLAKSSNVANGSNHSKSFVSPICFGRFPTSRGKGITQGSRCQARSEAPVHSKEPQIAGGCHAPDLMAVGDEAAGPQMPPANPYLYLVMHLTAAAICSFA
jgi:hypothetical protein